MCYVDGLARWACYIVGLSPTWTTLRFLTPAKLSLPITPSVSPITISLKGNYIVYPRRVLTSHRPSNTLPVVRIYALTYIYFFSFPSSSPDDHPHRNHPSSMIIDSYEFFWHSCRPSTFTISDLFYFSHTHRDSLDCEVSIYYLWNFVNSFLRKNYSLDTNCGLRIIDPCGFL